MDDHLNYIFLPTMDKSRFDHVPVKRNLRDESYKYNFLLTNFFCVCFQHVF